MINYFDTHCHVDLAEDRKSMVNQINQQRIYTLAVTNLPSLFEKNRATIPETKYLKHALGYHPELIFQFPNQLKKFQSQISKTRYIGEVGIDASNRNKHSLVTQIEVFERILQMTTSESNKILTIHSRKAEKKVLELLKQYRDGKKILHWFQGDESDIEEAIKLECYFSFNLKMLSTRKGKLLIKKIPPSRILLESDFPFTVEKSVELQRNYYQSIIDGLVKEIGIDKKVFEAQLRKNQLDVLN